jgi:UDP-N-acetylmuramyl pentapeptide phosphotransferase/UDP-N-acetylglucosamine-1-phosphate transferase
MAGSQGLFSGLALTGLFACAQRPDLVVASLSVAAACAGFLPWNLPRARVFMGDAGSVPLGFAVAALLLLGVLDGVLPVAVALLLPAVFLVDAGMTLVRRFLLGEQWYTAHRQHMYQRLIGKGWSHNQVLTLYQAINLFVVLPGVVLGAKYSGAAWLITGILILAMIVTWLSMSLKLGEST